VEEDFYKFDDIACMLRFAHTCGFQPSSASFYVTNYANGKDWVDARHAHFRCEAGVRLLS
jgi:hypothetical protein